MERVRGTREALTRQSRLVAVLCMSVDAILYVTNLRKPAFIWIDVFAVALILLVDAGLASSAKRSGLVAVGVAAVQVVVPLVFDPGSHHICSTGGMMAAYRVGAWLPAWPGLGAIGALAFADVLDSKYPGDGPLPVVLTILSSALLPWIVGRHTTTRSAYIADLERRADRQEQQERAAIQRALAEERSSIARDLHDMISHHVSAIGVHAGAARLALGTDEGITDAAAVRRSLSAVEAASRSAMTDLRRLLDLLHGKDDHQGRQPGMGNVDELLARVRAAGLAVTMTTSGAPLDLPGSVDVALYRILQEALTNALRHGDGAAEAQLEHHTDEVVLNVTNPLRHTSNGSAPGSGLTGIRDRVALFGGEVRFGPADGRWTLRVSLPTKEPE